MGQCIGLDGLGKVAIAACPKGLFVVPFHGVRGQCNDPGLIPTGLLSQLPGDRAVKALIEVAQDQSLSREQRKRAVFWLSQSESDAAQAYLEKVLARNSD